MTYVVTNADERRRQMLEGMTRKPEPPPIITEVIIDTSPEAHAEFLKAIQFLLRRIEARRAREREQRVEAGTSRMSLVM